MAAAVETTGKTVKTTNPVTAVSRDVSSLAGSVVLTKAAVQTGGNWLKQALARSSASPFPWLRVVGAAGVSLLSLHDIWTTYRTTRAQIGSLPESSDPAIVTLKQTAANARPPILAFGRNLNRSTLLGFALTAIGDIRDIDMAAFRRGAKIGDNYGPLEGATVLVSLFDPGLIYMGSQLSGLMTSANGGALAVQRNAQRQDLERDISQYTTLMTALVALMKATESKFSLLAVDVAKVLRSIEDRYSRWYATVNVKNKEMMEFAIKSLKNINTSMSKIHNDLKTEIDKIVGQLSNLNITKDRAISLISTQSDELNKLSALTADTLRSILAVMAYME